MEPRGRPRRELHLRELAAVLLQHVHSSKLVQLNTGEPPQPVLQFPRREIDVLGSHQRPYPGSIMPLFYLVPPSLALILHHGGFFYEDTRGRSHQIEQRRLHLSGGGRKELPAREDRRFASTSSNVSLK